jgi:hypothetical protein
MIISRIVCMTARKAILVEKSDAYTLQGLVGCCVKNTLFVL